MTTLPDPFDSDREDHDRPEPRPEPSRRTVVKAAAWSIPVIAAAVATPLAAASTAVACPVVSYWWGDYESVTVRSTDTVNGNQHRWRADSSGTITVGFGNLATNGNPGLSFSSPVPVNVALGALSYTYTLPYQVSWTSIPAGWSLAGTSSAGGQWTYQFQRSGAAATTITATTGPGTTLVAKTSATGTVIVPVGTILENYTSYTARLDTTYIPDFSGAYDGCVSDAGNDGVARARTQSATRPLVWAF